MNLLQGVFFEYDNNKVAIRKIPTEIWGSFLYLGVKEVKPVHDQTIRFAPKDEERLEVRRFLKSMCVL